MIILFLNRYRKQFEPIDKQIIVLFTPKIVTKLSEIWYEDPDPEKSIPDPGVKNRNRRLCNITFTLQLNTNLRFYA